MIEEYRSIGVVVLLSHCKAALREMIIGSGSVDSISPNSIFISNHDAVLFCLSGTQCGERRPLLTTATEDAAKDDSEVIPEIEDDDASQFVSVVDVNDIYVIDAKKSNGITTSVDTGLVAPSSSTPSHAEGEYTKL